MKNLKKLIAAFAILTTGCSVAYNAAGTKPPSATMSATTPSNTSQLGTKRAYIGTGSLPAVTYVPMHLAVPNPNVTQATVEASVRALLAGSTINSLSVVSTTMGWAQTNLNYVSPTYLPASSLWAVTVQGNLEIKDSVTHSGTIPTGSKALCAVDVEEGQIISVRLTP